ncbi:MAG: NfeD family protein [Thermoguttaceae bacterium]
MPVLLLLIGLGLALADIFFPSGGILAFLAICAIIGAVVKAFLAGSTLGLIILGVTLFGLPAVVILALKWWPSTSMGRKVLLPVPTSEEVLPENHPRRKLESLVGRVGRAKCKMLPSGIITIDNQSFDAVSEGAPIEAGQRVRVIEVRTNRLIVEGLAEEPLSQSDEDVLARPVDWESDEPFQSPPA